MARIRIEDLPITETMTPEEAELLLGAGRPGFRPTFEALEVRQMMDAAIGHALPALKAPIGSDSPQVGHMGVMSESPLLANQFASMGNNAVMLQQSAGHGVSNAALDALFAGGAGLNDGLVSTDHLNSMSLPPPSAQLQHSEVKQDFNVPKGVPDVQGVTWDAVKQDGTSQTRTGKDGSGNVYLDTLKGDGSFERTKTGSNGSVLERTSVNGATGEMQVFHGAARVLHGRQEGGVYVLETFNNFRPGVTHSKDTYDQAPTFGGTRQTTEATYADHKVEGHFKDGNWVETTTGSKAFQSRTETYDKGSGALVSRDTVTNDGSKIHGAPQKGKWVETTTGSKAFQSRTETFSSLGGKLESRETVTNEGWNIHGETKDGRWVETTAGSKAFRSRTIVFDREGGTILSRDTITNDGAKVHGEKVGDSWCETTTESKAFKTRTDVLDHIDGTLQSRTTLANDGSKIFVSPKAGGKWVETITDAPEFTRQVDVYDKVEGERTLFSRETNWKDGAATHGELKDGHWIETKFTGQVEFQKDGTIKMVTAPTLAGAQASGEYKVYQRVGDQWKQVFHKHQVQDPRGGSGIVWMEESWSADGKSYTQDIWEKENHAKEGETSTQHFSRTVVDVNGKTATTTFYHTKVLGHGKVVPYMWGSQQYGAGDAKVVYTHAIDEHGKLGEMQKFSILPDYRTDWGNTWTKDGGWDTNSGGWPYGGGGKGRPAGPGVVFGNDKFKLGFAPQLNPNAAAQTMSDLPFLNVGSRMKDGRFIETISNKDNTQSTQFVFSGPDRKQLLEQTVGHKEDGKWVQTTTRSQDLVTRLTDRLKAGGNEVRLDPRDISKTADGGFTLRYWIVTQDSPWTPNGVDRPPSSKFKQRWQGSVTLEFKKVGTVDGIDQYRLVNVTHDVTHVTTRSDFLQDGDTKSSDGAPLSGLGVTDADLQTLVSSWNERAIL